MINTTSDNARRALVTGASSGLGAEFARGDELEVELAADGQVLEFKALSTKT